MKYASTFYTIPALSSMNPEIILTTYRQRYYVTVKEKKDTPDPVLPSRNLETIKQYNIRVAAQDNNRKGAGNQYSIDCYINIVSSHYNGVHRRQK